MRPPIAISLCAPGAGEAVDAVTHRDGVGAPVDRRFALVDLMRVCGAFGALRTKGETSRGQFGQGFDDQARAD